MMGEKCGMKQGIEAPRGEGGTRFLDFFRVQGREGADKISEESRIILNFVARATE